MFMTLPLNYGFVAFFMDPISNCKIQTNASCIQDTLLFISVSMIMYVGLKYYDRINFRFQQMKHYLSA